MEYDLRIYAVRLLVLIWLAVIVIYAAQRHWLIDSAVDGPGFYTRPSASSFSALLGGTGSSAGASSSGGGGVGEDGAGLNFNTSWSWSGGNGPLIGQFEDNAMCVVCWNHPRDMAFACGHVASCHTCAWRLKQCPICRSPWRKKLRVYFP